MVKICFCAIFKNESKNVYRCLNGVKNVIDYISICDTGSTDNTIELIEQWGNDNNIPTQVHVREFVNFGYNRTLSVNLAKDSFKSADYLLLIDADMVLKINKTWSISKDTLDKSSYMFLQKSDSIEYWNIRLIKANLKWECIGVTHEYWECSNSNINRGKINSLWIDDREDGGCKDDKYDRDKKLLEDALKNEDLKDGLKGRYMFYLAQTYKCLNNYSKSIYWYQKRIDHGGWSEELYYSQLQIGLNCERMKSYERAIGEYLLAWNMRPIRAEPLQHISSLYREQSKHLLSYTFAKIGINIQYPSNDTLFIDYKTYKYLFHKEISICAYYLARDEHDNKIKEKYLTEGRNAASYIISLDTDISHHESKLAHDNIKFYI
uniref:Glycosyl transferase family 2 n=1 Tax=Pithovirus LCPAC102 TaxID=2506587 RepID=A0A481Z2V2_9VIRU|nr:MAG: glycosyl transferase family 2 [Pithovirus LCPAC102]